MDKKTYIKIKRNQGYYLPLFNFNGAYSSLTPFFGGDFKTDYHHYALKPVSEMDLYNLEFSRNILFEVGGKTYKLNGQTVDQQNDKVTYHYGMLYQTVNRRNDVFSLTTTSLLTLDDAVELHEVVIKNLLDKPLKMHITTAMPIYGRSAENLFDHRHVTSLLNRIMVHDGGIVVEPTLSFDERGHGINQTSYGVFTHIDGHKPTSYIPVLDDFIGGGSLSFPKMVKTYPVGSKVEGYEAIGAIRYENINIPTAGEVKLYVSISISDRSKDIIQLNQKYLNTTQFNESLLAVQEKFKKETAYIGFEMTSHERTNQLKWVTLQPILRRFFGNSYMPHHDYGHGGRGWRDLWQDLLSLIVSNDTTVKDVLYNNFKGVRIDGTNATIIGNKPGEFKADRNKIVRVWSDHGCWPLLTTKMYIDETGDIDFLLEKQTYFDDQFTHYTKRMKTNFDLNNVLYYEGTILEHLILQNLVGHFNVGDHGFTRLEDADWNDGLDMANKFGETIAFTHFYTNNLAILADLIEALNTKEIHLFEALYKLLFKQIDLNQYFDQVASFSESQKSYDKQSITQQLRNLSNHKKAYLQDKAWFDTYYQSYINNDGNFADSANQISLTGQTMALLNMVATKNQANKIASSTKDLLFDQSVGGYRLNSNYHEVLTNMGRAYGFAYGHKENGAVFAHMAVMYAYGLYQYDLVDYGYEAYQTLLDQALNKDSGVLAGIPEYFNNRGHGKYSYLTGSASWLIKLLRTEVFGIKMQFGQLTLNPKLSQAEFMNGKATIHTYIFGQKTTITYINKNNLPFGKYQIQKILLDGQNTSLRTFDKPFKRMEVYLDEHV